MICCKSSFQASLHRGWDLQTERRDGCVWFISSTLKNQFPAMEVLATMQNSAVTRKKHSQLWQYKSPLVLDNIALSTQLLKTRISSSPSKYTQFCSGNSLSSRNSDPSPVQTLGTGQICREVIPFTLPMVGSRIGKGPRSSPGDKLCLWEKFARRMWAGLLEKVISLQGESPRNKQTFCLSLNPALSR